MLLGSIETGVLSLSVQLATKTIKLSIKLKIQKLLFQKKINYFKQYAVEAIGSVF